MMNNVPQEDVLYRMPQVEDDHHVPNYMKNIGNLNNLPSVNGANGLGMVGNAYTPVQKYMKPPIHNYASGAKYLHSHQQNSIDSYNPGNMHRSRSKDALNL